MSPVSSPAAEPAEPAEVGPSAGLGLLDVVRLLLENDPNVVLAESVRDAARGSLLTASGRFDPRITTDLTGVDDELPGADGAVVESEALDLALGLDTELRTGTVLSPRVTVSRDETLGPGALQQATVSFTVRQPLLRDRGRGAVAAAERAARQALQAAELDLRHTVSLRIQAAVSQYWRLRSAWESLDILRASEERSRELLETTRRLIDADRIPAAEILQLQADLAAKETARIRGEQELFAARQALGRELGLGYAEIQRLPPPADPFPSVAPEQTPSMSAADRFLSTALRLRADLAAARERLDASRIRTRAADNDLLPRLDLLLTPGYSGRVEGAGFGDFFRPLFDRVPGLSTAVTLSLSWPTFNREARGGLIQARAAEQIDAAAVDLVETDVVTRVPTALDALARSVEELERAVQAVGLFEQVAVNEEKKLRAGTSTIIDVITQQDRLTGARRSVVSARFGVAQALLDVRFETATLLAQGTPGYVVSYDGLTTVPEMNDLEEPGP